MNIDNGFVACSEPMTKLMGMVQRIARSSAAVLITGETGVGKEIVARAVHLHSFRADKPFIDLNCAALPEHLVESELFGYEKGAFSGADAAKPGLFELADGGTLFLDEIGELEPKIQVKLLRVLDGAPYYRLGGNRKVTSSVRVLAATNQSLDDAIRTGRFRRDLYHRLCQFQLRVPPLRDRKADIPPLVQHFVKKENLAVKVSPEVMSLFETYDWPGNIRELRNVLLQASANTESGEIHVTDLPQELVEGSSGDSIAPESQVDLNAVERSTILRALAMTGGRQGAAAEQLGISRRTLCRKLKQFRISRESSAPSEALGVLSPEQQTSYRTNIELPVTLTTAAGEKLALHSVNLSAGGMSVRGISEGLRLAGAVTLDFDLPGGRAIRAQGRIVWAEPHGRAGVQFVELSDADRAALSALLHRLQAEEGWSAEPTGGIAVD